MTNRFFGPVLTGICLWLAALAPHANAQSGAKTVTLVVPYAAGGNSDSARVARVASSCLNNAASA